MIYRSECKLNRKHILLDQRTIQMGMNFTWVNTHKDIYLSLRLYFMGMMLLLLNKLCYKHILLDLRTNQKDIKKLKVCKYLMLDKYKNLC